MRDNLCFQQKKMYFYMIFYRKGVLSHVDSRNIGAICLSVNNTVRIAMTLTPHLEYFSGKTGKCPLRTRP